MTTKIFFLALFAALRDQLFFAASREKFGCEPVGIGYLLHCKNLTHLQKGISAQFWNAFAASLLVDRYEV